ncbi:hypothetical protein DV515_00018259 [Chloebia gouldiae]|uniref:Uncharacterized protein n=1 Tax=Chloebia gouldiae TaxID=44316 RepID=A0A3L8Q801_CHLGU|nr:hypothetical protein DV515_00018259 [Chloebia gouldiae]
MSGKREGSPVSGAFGGSSSLPPSPGAEDISQGVCPHPKVLSPLGITFPPLWDFPVETQPQRAWDTETLEGRIHLFRIHLLPSTNPAGMAEPVPILVQIQRGIVERREQIGAGPISFQGQGHLPLSQVAPGPVHLGKQGKKLSQVLLHVPRSSSVFPGPPQCSQVLLGVPRSFSVFPALDSVWNSDFSHFSVLDKTCPGTGLRDRTAGSSSDVDFVFLGMRQEVLG